MSNSKTSLASKLKTKLSASKDPFAYLDFELRKHLASLVTKEQRAVLVHLHDFRWKIRDLLKREDGKLLVALVAENRNQTLVYPDGRRRTCSGSVKTLTPESEWVSLGAKLLEDKRAKAREAKFEELCTKWKIPADEDGPERERLLAMAILNKMLDSGLPKA